MVKKGSFGYIRNRQKINVVVSVIALAFLITVFLLARWHYETNRNVFTILVALGCLPTGTEIVHTIMMVRAKGCSQDAQRMIRKHVGRLQNAYDLYMTSYEQNFQISHICVASGTVAALTEDRKLNPKAAENHLRQMMEDNGFHNYAIKVFRSRERYLTRMDQMNDLSGKADSQTMRELIALFLSISL